MNCPHCQSNEVTKKGFFKRKLARRRIQRFYCTNCKSKFSASTLSSTYWQKKPHLNKTIYLNLCSGMSLRRTAKNLDVCFMTVYSRFLWLADLANSAHKEFLESLHSVSELYLDEMESIEHTKLKPLTLPLLVDQEQRILGISAGVMPAKGHLAEISRRKYGYRVSESSQLITQLLGDLPTNIAPIIVKTDGKTSYRVLIECRLPGVRQEIYVRKAEKEKEQPFLNHHKKKFDPMFAINQRCAKLRADVNRLIRRSWCTTKKIENLRKHLILYACYNNKVQFI